MRWFMVLVLVASLAQGCFCNMGPNVRCYTRHNLMVAYYDEKRPDDAPDCATVDTWIAETAKRFEVATCPQLPRTTAVELVGWLSKSFDQGVGARCTFGYPAGNWHTGNRLTVAPLGMALPSGKTVDRAYQRTAFQHELTHMWIDGLLGGVSRDVAWDGARRTAVDHDVMKACNLHL